MNLERLSNSYQIFKTKENSSRNHMLSFLKFSQIFKKKLSNKEIASQVISI